MTFLEFVDSDILGLIKKLETVEDMNSVILLNTNIKILDPFSYKHFYVIYCKFWELDSNNAMRIDESSLQTFDCCALTTRMASRVIQGCGLGRNASSPGFMTYREFIPFIIASEAKSITPSIEYWFRCLDTDGDGVISLHELFWFWEEQFDRMTMSRMSDPWKFDDFVCNLYSFYSLIF